VLYFFILSFVIIVDYIIWEFAVSISLMSVILSEILLMHMNSAGLLKFNTDCCFVDH